MLSDVLREVWSVHKYDKAVVKTLHIRKKPMDANTRVILKTSTQTKKMTKYVFLSKDLVGMAGFP